jgi:hypothetical protein
MDFELIGPIKEVQQIAAGRSIRELSRLRKRFGGSRWRKMKGIAQVRLLDSTVHTAAIHWYESLVSDGRNLR